MGCMSRGAYREVAGFFCRWLLLAGAGLTAAVVAWGSLLATAGLSQEVGTTIVLGDWVALPAAGDDGFAYVIGPTESTPAVRGVDIGLAVSTGHPLRIVRSCSKGCVIPLDNPQAGTIRVLLRGAPYSAAAYQAHPLRLLCVPRDVRLFLVDARLSSRAGPAGRQAWQEGLDAMRTAGWVALFHPGPAEAFRRCVRRLRATGVGEPILFDPRAADVTDTLNRVERTLRRSPRGQGMEVVTADGHLARRAQKRGFVTHWIGAAEGQGVPSRTLRRHRGLANLKDSLSR